MDIEKVLEGLKIDPTTPEDLARWENFVTELLSNNA
jgi:hypothetical protein